MIELRFLWSLVGIITVIFACLTLNTKVVTSSCRWTLVVLGCIYINFVQISVLLLIIPERFIISADKGFSIYVLIVSLCIATSFFWLAETSREIRSAS